MISVFSRAFHVDQAFFNAELLYFLLLHLSMVNQVRLVAHKEENSVLLCVGFHLVHPKFADVFEAEWVCEVKY